MKKGLLLKEAPEPISIFYCFANDCNGVFYYVDEYKKHSLEIHNKRCEYILDEYDYQYGGKGEIYHAKDWSRKWVTPEESQGRMQVPLEFPHRPVQRFGASIEQLQNRAKPHTCHCGKSFKWPRRSYCSDECSNEWNFKLTSYWDGHKTHFLDQQPTKVVNHIHFWTCEDCKLQTKDPEVDHIIAIILGGHPWDYRNLQVLCNDCHKIKTKNDIGILAEYKRQANYDIGPIIPDPQLTLDDVMNFDYAYN